MLAITVEFLHGTIRATGSEDTAITGAGDAGEWPPSPARLFSALVAAGGTGSRAGASGCSELRILEQATPPRILADRLDVVMRSSLRERFVVEDASKPGSVQEYAARTARAVRPGTRLAPRSSEVVYVWDDLDVDDVTLSALQYRAARVGYLGCADSPARVSASRTPPEARDEWLPSDDGGVVLPVPYDGFLDALDDAFRRAQQGEAIRRAWVPNRYVRYRVPGSREDRAPEPVMLWLLFETAVSGRRLRAVTETLRATVLERYEREFCRAPEDVPPVLHGHGFEGTGHQHAHFLALPDVGHRHARGRLHGAAVLLPAGTDPLLVEAVRTCLWRITTLNRPGVFATAVRPYAGEPRPLAATPTRWIGPSRRWVSATPVVHERFQRGGPDLDEVARWCAHADVDGEVTSFRIARPPLLPGGCSLHPSEVAREGRAHRPYSHLEVVFAQAISGPLVLGAARQFGFGLMLPVDASRADA